MMPDPNPLLNLPIESLMVIAAGYLSYRIAYTGRDQNHKSADILLISTAFAAIVKLALIVVLSPYTLNDTAAFAQLITGLLGSVTLTLICASIWRAKLGPWIREQLNYAGISIHDGFKTAWQTLIADDGRKLSHMTVYLTNGDAYFCDQMSRFHDLRTKSCILGEDGSVALYITHFRANGKDDWVDVASDNAVGPATTMTFIPASQIKMIDTGGN